MIKEIIGKKGYKTYIYNDKTIYSIYDPFIEAERYLSSQTLKENVITICGADFINTALDKNNEIKQIISFELLDEPFEKNNLSSKIYRINNISELEKKIKILGLTSENCSIILWKEYIAINFDIKKDIVEKIKYFLIKNSLNKININTFENLEKRNIEINIKKNNRIKSLLHDCKFLENTPSIIISSGNYLKENIQTIKAIENKFLVFAYPSALEYLEKNDINIDYVIAVDPGYATLYHLYKYKKQTKLLTTLSIHPSIDNLNNYEKYYFNYGSELENKLYKNYNILLSIPQGSVAFNLFDILTKLGCTEILLFAQDFCYYENKSHIAGGNFETEFITKSNYLRSYEQQQYLHKMNRIKTYINVDGKKLLSETSLYIYFNHFISNIDKFKNLVITGNVLHNYEKKIPYKNINLFDKYKIIEKSTLPFKEININLQI